MSASRPSPPRPFSRGLTRALAALSMVVAVLAPSVTHAASRHTTTPQVPRVHLPTDQAGHPQAKNEWWYVVGHVKHGSRTFGYETTIFKLNNVKPPGFSSPVNIYRTDVAITDENGHRFHQSITYHFPQSGSISSKRLNAKVGPAHLRAIGSNKMTLSSSLSGGSIDMTLTSKRPPMYVGGSGYIPFSGGYTYYYSLTDLTSGGTITLGKQRFKVTGVSWLDHQWGNWSMNATRGWQWMALQLSNGVQLSIFDVKSGSGPVRAASLLMKDGKTRTAEDARITPRGTWRSPHTGGVYPASWTVIIPSLKTSLQVTPTVRDQELFLPNQPFGSYWEGSGRITGTFGGKRVSGKSYTELTGYARR